MLMRERPPIVEDRRRPTAILGRISNPRRRDSRLHGIEEVRRDVGSLIHLSLYRNLATSQVIPRTARNSTSSNCNRGLIAYRAFPADPSSIYRSYE